MSKISVDTDLIRELAALIEEVGLTELEVTEGDRKLRLSRGGAAMVVATPAGTPAAAPSPGPATTPPAGDTKSAAAEHPGAVKSPMVGTAYVAAEPGATPFVNVGDTVTLGQTVIIVEAMKTMNPIPAPQGGRVTEILVSDGQPVEFGEALIIIE